jgi:hypothetical protein
VSHIEISGFPHKELRAFDRSKNLVMIQEARKLLFRLPDIMPPFEVLYVGKSLGIKKQLNCSDRLYKQHHRKFKQAIIDTHTDHPDKEIYIFAFNYLHAKNNVTMLSKGPEFLDDKEFNRFHHLQNLQVSRKEKINIIEEALINYFMPPYNELLKESLAKLTSKTIKYFQESDIAGITVELSLNESLSKLYSAHVPAKTIHIIPFATFENKSRFAFAPEEELSTARKRETDYLLQFI